MMGGMNAPGGRQGPANSPSEWFQSLPPVTRVWFTLAAGMTLGHFLGLLDPINLAFMPSAITSHFQVWRLFTAFSFVGKLDFGSIMMLIMIVQYSNRLESMYNGHTAQYAWVLIMAIVTMILLSLVLPFFHFFFFSVPLVMFTVWIFCRRLPEIPMSIFGLFNIQSAHLPWFIMLMNMLVSQDGITVFYQCILGYSVGHLYHYLEDVHPSTSKGRLWILQAPLWFRRLIPNEIPRQSAASGGAVFGRAPFGRDNNNNNNGGRGVNPYARPPDTTREEGRHNWGPGRRLG